MHELKTSTTQTLATHRLIPVVSLPDADLAEPLGDALVAAELPIVEITLRTPAATQAIRTLAQRDDLFVAAGTVVTIDQAQQAADAGAQCLLSPGTDPAVIEWCVARDIDIIPGVATPTDILLAKRLGLGTLKFFPAEAMGGVASLRAIAGPLPETRFIPTGGITADNVSAYLSLPSVLACGGSWIATTNALQERDFKKIQSIAEQAVCSVARTRSSDLA
jgi:2-dehydro-3-deoxyphosphogluconate aldolase/(4S)-4-hydroxy-2-oxoglutarate aldolase